MALKIADIKCEIREVRLNNKPKHMIKVSPKGTVPILILKDRIIEESMEIIDWVLEKKHIFQADLSSDEKKITTNTIKLFDTKFKYHLDRYKYANRYSKVNSLDHRNECENILINVENFISCDEWFFGKDINKLDISILPFIRQFRIADPDWFDNNLKIIKVKNYLHNFLESKILKDVMINYNVWTEESETSFFPITNQ